MSPALALPTPSADELAELLQCARYGEADDLVDLQKFVERYGASWLAEAKDDRGNTCLHMAGGNGHVGTSRSASLAARRKSSNASTFSRLALTFPLSLIRYRNLPPPPPSSLRPHHPQQRPLNPPPLDLPQLPPRHPPPPLPPPPPRSLPRPQRPRQDRRPRSRRGVRELGGRGGWGEDRSRTREGQT